MIFQVFVEFVLKRGFPKINCGGELQIWLDNFHNVGEKVSLVIKSQKEVDFAVCIEFF